MERKPAVAEPDDEIAPGSIITGFQALLPHTDEVCRQQIASSALQGLPDAMGARRGATIIGNGPSARDLDLRSLTGTTLAVNGALKLFTDQGLAPTYWAACDPQAILADYLPADPPHATTYIVAAKCHPSVFDKLRNRMVKRWHLTDFPAPGCVRTPTASTVTLSGAWFLYQLGFMDFDFWGWDGCFLGDRHHASDSAAWVEPVELNINYGGKIVGSEVIGGKNFATSRSWAAEAHSAGQFFQLASYFDIGITIHGDGMFKAAYEFMMEQVDSPQAP